VPTDEHSTTEETHSTTETVVEELLKKLRAAAEPGKDNRVSARYPVAIPVTVVPIDESGEPIERPFTAMSRDISTSGICILHTRPTNAKQLIIILTIPGKPPAKLNVDVVRCRAIGRFYEIAAKFTSRMNS